MDTEELIKKFNLVLNYETYPSGVQHIDIIERNGETIKIAGDKHAYVCEECGCIFQSKNLYSRNLFDTSDSRTSNCNISHSGDMLRQVCKCDPIV